VSFDQGTSNLRVLSHDLNLSSYEAGVVVSLLGIAAILPNDLSAQDICRRTGLQGEEAVDDVLASLQEKLDQVLLANEGGNGSFYEDTIYGGELFVKQGDRYTFNSDLAKIITEEKKLNDEQLSGINYQPRYYQNRLSC